jgi:hypothetical protein
VSSFKSLGSSLGINKKGDYILMSLKTGKSFLLDVDSSNKNINLYGGCKPKKKGIFPYNECSKMVSKESLEGKLGGKNRGHYYWAVDWVRTPEGTMAVVNEGTELLLLNFDTGEKKVAFSRTMGVNDFDILTPEGGQIGLRVKLGFSYENLDDMFSSFDTLPSASK